MEVIRKGNDNPITVESIDSEIERILTDERIYLYAESLKQPWSIINKGQGDWVKTYGGGPVKPCAHEYQRLMTYPWESPDKLAQMKEAIFYLYFAGNQGGKSVWGGNWVLMECLGIHPLQELGVRPKPPVHWWIVSQELPAEAKIDTGEDSTIVKTIREWCPPNEFKMYRKDKIMTIRGSVINWKSHDQDKSKFKGERLDGIFWDEEPPKPLWEEGVPRIMKKKGIFLLAMTADYGSWSWQLLKNKKDQKYYICEMDSFENPFMDTEFRAKLMSSMTEEQLLMRRFGKHIQFKGKVFPFDYDRNVGRPFVPNKETSQYVIIDWHPAKPIIISFLSINANNIWYVFRESVIESHVVEAVAREYYSKLTFPDYKLPVVKTIIDPIASVDQVQDGRVKPKSVVDMLRDFGISCKTGNPHFESGHAFLTRKLNYRELWFDPDCKLHIDQWDTWGAKRYQKGNLEGNLRDQLEVEGNDTCVNMIYAYNEKARFMPQETEDYSDRWTPPRASTARIYGRQR